MYNLESFLKQYEKVPATVYPNQTHIQKPLVTVCVFTYNQEKYIGQCLDGILNQKTNFDYIIYLGEDDSRKDQTREICLAYAKAHPNKIRLVLHHAENRILLNGRISARFNMFYAFLSSKTKYLAICEGDDFWTDPFKLQKQVDFLEKNQEYGICYTDCDVIKEEGCFPDGKTGYYSKNSFSFDFFNSLLKKSGPTLTVLFERNLIDWTFYIQSIQSCAMGDWPIECLVTLKKKGYRMNEVTAVYNRHSTGATIKWLTKRYTYCNSRISFCKCLMQHPDLNEKQRWHVRDFILRLYLKRAYLYLRDFEISKSLKDYSLYLKLRFDIS